MKIKSKPSHAPQGCGMVFLLCWALFWITFVVIFDFMAISGLAKQWQTVSYVSTQGTITKSQVKVTHDSDGSSRSAEIEYEYQVNGQKLTSEDVSHVEFNFDDADESVAKYPMGAACEVYYSPQDPTQSVLETGIRPGDLFAFIFLTPFNAIGIGILAFVIPWDRLPMGPVSIKHRQDVLRHRYEIFQVLRWQSAIVAGGAAGFVMVFLTLLVSWLLPGWLPILFAFAMIGASAGLAGLFTQSQTLEVDPMNGQFQLTTSQRTHSETFDRGLRFVKESKKVTLRHPGNSVSPLPQLKFYSDTARDWFLEELQRLMRDCQPWDETNEPR